MIGATEAVLAAVTREISQRRAHLDGAEDLGAITITIKLQAGTTWIRGVTWQEERLYRGQTDRRLKT